MGRCSYKTFKAFKTMVFAVPGVQAKGKLIDIAPQVLRAGVMINPIKTPFQDRPHAVNAVRGHAVFDIIPGAVINRPMPVKQTVQARVNRGIIRMNHGADGHMVKDYAMQGRFIRAVKGFGNRVAASLPESDNTYLADRTTALFEFLTLMLGGFLSPDIGFIDFDDSPEFCKVITTSFPEPVQHEPGRLLGNAYLLRELQGGYALPGRHKQVHGIEPLMQGNVAPLKDRAGSHGKIFFAGIAAVKALLSGGDSLTISTDRAFYTVGPQLRFEIFPGRFLIRKHFEKLEGADRYLVHCSKQSRKLGTHAGTGRRPDSHESTAHLVTPNASAKAFRERSPKRRRAVLSSVGVINQTPPKSIRPGSHNGFPIISRNDYQNGQCEKEGSRCVLHKFEPLFY